MGLTKINKNFLYRAKKDVCKSVLFFIFYFFTFVAVVFAYYDFDFTSADELNYFYESGLIDQATYEEYLTTFEYFEEEFKDGEKLGEKQKLDVKFITELDDYKEKNSDFTNYLKLKYNVKNFEFGGLGIYRNVFERNYDEAQHFFATEKLDKKLDLEKFYIKYSAISSSKKSVKTTQKPQNKNVLNNPEKSEDFVKSKTFVDEVWLGNFQARFGMGLTFGLSNKLKEGFSEDLNLPFRRNIPYEKTTKKEFINNNFLMGVGIYKIFKNFEFYYAYSSSENPLDAIQVKNIGGEIKKQTVNSFDHEEIQAASIVYNFINFFKVGGVYYSAKNEYFHDLFSTKNYEGKGLFFDLNSNNFFYKNEISFANKSSAFVNKFGFDNKKDFDFYVSYRNYDFNYENPFSNSLSLHPDKKYFKCSDEEGFRFSGNYGYDFSRVRKIQFNFESDVFQYSKKRIYDSKTKTYNIFAFPKTVNKTYFARTRFTNQNIFYEVGYRFYDRDVAEIARTFYKRKDEYLDYKIGYDLKAFNFSAKYSKKIKGIDIPEYKYFSEYMNFYLKILLFKKTFFQLK